MSSGRHRPPSPTGDYTLAFRPHHVALAASPTHTVAVPATVGTSEITGSETYADKVVVMYDGEVVQIGTPEELFDEPAHTLVGYFIGSPGMNILPGDVEGATVGVAGGRIALDQEYPAGPGTVEIGIRPEFVRVTDAAGANGAGLPMQVRAVENIGRLQIVRGSVGGHDVDAVVEEGARVPAEAFAVFDPARINVYRDSHLVRAPG